MKDHYKEYMEAGVMPGNLEKNDRLLTPEEIDVVHEPCTNDKDCPFGIADESVPLDGSDDYRCGLCHEIEIAKAQLAKVDNWWIEKIEGQFQIKGYNQTLIDCDLVGLILISEPQWQALKKQIGGEQ